MRRSDRQVTDINGILSIIDKCEVCNLGLSRNDEPYVVPLNFGYTFEDGRLTLYFHGAGEGKKHDIIAQNPKACFSMICGHELAVNEKGCAHTMYYESVMGTGIIESLSDTEEKRAGLVELMRHYSPEREFSFTDAEITRISVLRLNVLEFTAKKNKKQNI